MKSIALIVLLANPAAAQAEEERPLWESLVETGQFVGLLAR